MFMLQDLETSLADQTQLRLHLSSGLILEGVVARLEGVVAEIRHTDGSRTQVLVAHIIATTIN
jgi:hypothetical protein